MKLLRIMWVLSIVWASLFLYLAVDFFLLAWGKETSLLEWGGRLETYLAGVGALSVGALPLLGTWIVHRFHKSRERVRLAKQRTRIDKRIDKIDRKRAAKSGEAAEAV